MRILFLKILFLPGRAFFKISSALPDTNELNEFLLLTKDDIFVAINESFIYPTKTSTNFIDEEHRPTLKYNLTLKYHEPSKEISDNQLPEETNIQGNGGIYKYLESKNQQSDANQQFSDERQESHVIANTQEASHVRDSIPSTGRETVEQSIKRRNVLIQKLLNTQIGPPISPKKVESIRFVDVVSPPPKEQSENVRLQDENQSPNRKMNERFDDAFTSPVQLDMYCRSPKSVSFNPQPQSPKKSQDDDLDWKTKQQETFMTALRKKGKEYLKSLEEEWMMRQSKEEEKLDKKMRKCKLLTEALEHALSAIKVGYWLI